MEARPTDAERVLLDIPDAGRANGILYRLRLKQTTRVWGGRFVLRSPFIDKQVAWWLRHGRYEAPEIRLALRHFDPALPLVELGGGLGVVATVVNRHLADPSQHVVVEMDEQAAAMIERNRAMNGARFDLLRATIDYDHEPVSMSRQVKHFQGGNHVVRGENGRRPAERTSLARIADEREWTRFNLLMDIEGAEERLIEHEADVLRAHVQSIVMEFHPNAEEPGSSSRALNRLAALGFEPVDWLANTMAFANTRLGPGSRPRRKPRKT